MANISIDEAKAHIWIQDVNDELSEVKEVLRKVTEASTSVPGEDDVIMQGIENTCNALSTFWNGMCDGFSKSCNILGQIIGNLKNAATETVADINEVKSKIGS